MTDERIVHRCKECEVNPVCKVSMTVWDGTENAGGVILELCGKCLDKLAKDYKLKDINGNYAGNFTLQNKKYEKYLNSL